MEIRENEANRNDIPPFEVLNKNGEILHYAVTREECEIYISDNL